MLQGLLAIDVSRLLPGPFCTLILRDLGARVISVDSPGPEDITAIEFPMLMRGKERIFLDLKTKKGREVFLRLIERADILVEGYRPGTTARLGIDHETVSKLNPQLIYCSLTGFGQNPEGAQVGHDINFMAASGLADLIVSDDADGVPTIPAVQFGDAVGSLAAVIGILAALLERSRTGRGRWLDISITDCLPSLAVTAFTFMKAGMPYRTGRSSVAGGLACYGLYRTADGRLLAVGALEAHIFASLCKALDLDDLVPLQYVPDKQRYIRQRLGAVFRTKTAQEWTAFFAGRETCVTPVVPFEEAVVLPGFVRTGALQEASTPQGQKDLFPAFPIGKLTLSPTASRIPARGEHTASILAELGCAS